MKRIYALILVVSFALSLCACGVEKTGEVLLPGISTGQEDQPDQKTSKLQFVQKEKNIQSTFSKEDSSPQVYLSEKSGDALEDMAESVRVVFPAQELFQTEECYRRLKTDIRVSKHQYSALNQDNVLEAGHLREIVKQNNQAYLSEHKYGLIGIEEPDDAYLLDVCTLIVDTVTALKNTVPGIDYGRICCNLGNLKVFYKKGMIENAQVTAELVLQTSPYMLEAAESMHGEDATRDIIIHEIMHIAQIGCACEGIGNCTRRCGISYRWSDFALNTTDFGWFFEGSAERVMCNLIGREPITYSYMINYICALNQATMLDDDVPANYAETISFFGDPERLYELFDCETKEDCCEVLNMMVATNIVHMEPEEFMTLYASEKNVDIEDDAVLNDLNNTLKPAICMVWTKQFYRNLADALSDEKMTANDLCFQIALFEATLHNVLRYNKEELSTYNNGFLTTYKALRQKLFDGVVASCGVDLQQMYEAYAIYVNDKTVNASMNWNDRQKNLFYLERVDYLAFSLNARIH